MDRQLESRIAGMLGMDEADPVQRLATDLAREDRQFIDELVAARRERGLTQRQVADRMGVSQGAVSHFEAGDRDPRLSTIRRYALALGVPVHHRVAVGGRGELMRDGALRGREARKQEVHETSPSHDVHHQALARSHARTGQYLLWLTPRESDEDVTCEH